MENNQKQMQLVLQMVSGYGGEFRSWRFPDANEKAYIDMDYYVEKAKIAEKWKFHGLFIADTPALTVDMTHNSPMHPMEPILALTAVARETKNIGLITTVSTTLNYPYNIARQMKTLDIISGGRAGWNAVTSSTPAAVENFGMPMKSRTERYEQAHEVIEVVQKLWWSFGKDALILDKNSGKFADMSQIKPINFEGKYVSSAGPLLIPASPQGQPPIFQAGPSDAGIELADRFASGVYANPFTKEEAKEYREILRNAAKKYGRNPDEIKVYTGFMFSIANSEAEALERRKMLVDFSKDEIPHRVQYLGQMLGLRVNPFLTDINKPIPENLQKEMYANPYDPRSPRALELTKKGHTIKEILAYGVINYHPVVVGTAVQIADFLEEWFTFGACDGFSIVPDSSHDGVEKFVDEVVPILQERGIFHKDYEGSTLRENMQIPYQYGFNR